jgi:hypothetical protein
MMLLPERDDVLIEGGKIEYLLDPAKGKAGFFLRFGSDARTLETALLEHARATSVDVGPRETDYGARYELVGPLLAPDGRAPTVRSIWQFDADSPPPRLITAHPE